MLTAVLLAPLAVLVGQVLARDGLELVPVATTVGVLAAIVQFRGLARWPFLVPALARTYEDPNLSPAAREPFRAVSVVRAPLRCFGCDWLRPHVADGRGRDGARFLSSFSVAGIQTREKE
jgi:hypothetical protein